MKKLNSVQIKGVGSVLFERSSRAKYLNISVKPFKGVRVAVPKGVSFRKAEQVVRSKVIWIQKHLNKMKYLEQNYEAVSERMVEIDHEQAKRILVTKLNEMADRYGFKYNMVHVRNQKTLWGSCSAENNISLNMKLLLLPDNLRDYVIIHELVHTQIKNHSNEFWAELQKIVPNAKTLAKRINSFCLGGF